MAREGKIKVAIADDHPSIREGMKRLIDNVLDIELVGEAGNGQEAVDLVIKSKPDVLILDLQMPVMDGFQVIECLFEMKSNVIILILSAEGELGIVEEILSKGAWEYYLKEDAPQHLVKAIRRAARGGRKSCSSRFSDLDMVSV